jgi:hypothetical protein
MLVSAQAAPNLLAAADAELKPQRAALVISGPMQARADALAKVLAEIGIEVVQHRLRDEHDPRAVEADLLDWFSPLEGKDVYLNLTGGTKLMALTALAVAEAADWHRFYIDADTDHVVWLGRDAPPARKLNERVRLRHYLAAYGIGIDGELQRREPTEAQRAFLQEVLLYYERYLTALPLLNHALQRAEERNALGVELTETEADSRSLAELLDPARRHGMATLVGTRLAVKDEATRDFLKGGWLEQHVFDTVAQLQGGLGVRDRAVNLRVRHGGVANELDVAFLCRNRLHVIECKTGNLRADDGARANDALFKLAENARRLGGLATRGMLVSYRPLRDSEMRLAGLLQIEVVHGRDVPRLREKLRTWCGGR